MPTIVDSLIVTLALDPQEFTKGQKAAAAAFIKTRKEMEREGKLAEQAAEGMARGITNVTRRVVELYATFLGARGLTEFISGLATGDAALGRFAHNLGMSPQLVSAWEMAVGRMGGNASDAAGTMERLGRSLYDLRYNAKSLPPEFFQLQQAARMKIPLDQGLPAFMNNLAAALKRVYAANPARAKFMAEALGIDPNTFNLMVQYGDQIGRYVDKLKQLAPSDAAIKASQQLQAQWAQLQQQAQSLGNVILTVLGPQLETLLTQMTDWVNKNQDWIRTSIVEAVQQFAHWLQSIDWKTVAAGFSQMAGAAKDIADGLGGAVGALKVLFSLWLGSQFLKVLSNVRELNLAMGGRAGGAAGGLGRLGGGVLGTLGLGGLINLIANPPGAPTAQHMYDMRQGWSQWVDKNVPGAAWWDKNFAAPTPLSPDAQQSAADAQQSAAQESYQFWRSKGLSAVAALAMVGNEQGESGFDPHAVGDGGAAGGSFQWHKDRRDRILAATGIDVWSKSTSHLQQLQAAYYEMSMGLDPGAGRAWNSLQTAATVRDAMKAAVYDFERPLNKGSAALTRLDYARSWASKLSVVGGAGGANGMNRASTPSSVSQTNIQHMSVYSSSDNAPGIAGDIKKHLMSGHKTAAANTGLR